ncbi:transcription antitermination factor NusB [Oleidesulfovibrio sp.]|uniref:transcription antitermination factor NusB n=1 Tax=Oleidesulfovibrio sp. TaxID=2909707 RepID=UPI003A8AA4E6
MAKANNSTRRSSRALAFQVLYGLNFSPASDIEELRDAYCASPDVSDRGGEAHPVGFAWELIEGTWTNQKELDEVITRFAQNWRVERIGKIELTILRLAVYEMLYRADVPPKVAINEGIELSKQFGDQKSRSFINGILDAAAKALEAGTLTCKY